MFVLLLHLCNKWRINIMWQDHCVQSLFFEHIDILALLLFICYIVDCCLLCFFLFCWLLCIFTLSLFLRFCFSAIFFDAFFECHILVIQVLEQNIIAHLLAEFFIFQAAEFDKWADVIPVFLIVFFICLAHSWKLVSNFLGNVFGDLLYESIILQCASWYVKRQIRTINDSF